MAVTPTPANTAPKKRKSNGPRVVKDRVVFLAYKGQLEADSVKVFETAEQVLDAKEADGALNYKKVVIPARKSMRKTADQNANPAQPA